MCSAHPHQPFRCVGSKNGSINQKKNTLENQAQKLNTCTLTLYISIIQSLTPSIKCKAALQSQMTVCQIKEYKLLPNCCCIVDRPSLRDKDHKTLHSTGQTSAAPRNITPRFLCGQINQMSKEHQQCFRSLCWRVWNSASTGRKGDTLQPKQNQYNHQVFGGMN